MKNKFTHRYVDNIKVSYDELDKALQESIRLQSHYAILLNQLDGGQRIVFNSTGDWIKRLRIISRQKRN